MDYALDEEVLGIRLPPNRAIWTDILMHESDLALAGETICDDLGLRPKWHLQLATEFLRNLF